MTEKDREILHSLGLDQTKIIDEKCVLVIQGTRKLFDGGSWDSLPSMVERPFTRIPTDADMEREGWVSKEKYDALAAKLRGLDGDIYEEASNLIEKFKGEEHG